jgi:flagellar biosynthesis GTPase FlhF
MNGSIFVTALWLAVCGQNPSTESKPVPAPPPARLPKVPATAYHPKAKDVAYLNRQTWSFKAPAKGKPLPVLATQLCVTKPDQETFEKGSLLYRDGQVQDKAKLEEMMKAGDVSFLPANTKVSVVAPHKEVSDPGFFYPVEVKVLEGPAKDLVLWTGFQNVSRGVEKNLLAEQRKAELKATLEKKKARTAQKNSARAAKSAREQAAAQQELANESKLARTAEQQQNMLLKQQSALMEQQRIRTLQELNSQNFPIITGGSAMPASPY